MKRILTATDENQIEVWCVDAAGTPDDFSDDRVIDALYCHDCDGNDD